QPIGQQAQRLILLNQSAEAAAAMSSSRGKSENAALIQNAMDQMDRLVNQLSDLEESRAELDPEEFEELSRETREQLVEFEAFLAKMKSGDVSLVDQVSAMQLAIRAAISDAFRTPEVIRFFAQKQPGALRTRLAELDRDMKVGRLGQADGTRAKVEVLAALQKLGESLHPSEEAFLSEHASAQMKEFVSVAGASSAVSEDRVSQAVRGSGN
ncbi:hypothetical protein BOX15_Mlig022782g1, partial [Macrostomum lignano]